MLPGNLPDNTKLATIGLFRIWILHQPFPGQVPDKFLHQTYKGGDNFHGKWEYDSRNGLEKSTEMLAQLVQIIADSNL